MVGQAPDDAVQLTPLPPPPRRAGLQASGPALGALVLAASLALLWIAWMFARPLSLLLAAIIVASAFDPLVARLERRVPRMVAIMVPYLSVVGLIALVGWLIVPSLAQQGQQISDAAPQLTDRAQRFLESWGLSGPDQALESLQSSVSGGASLLVSLPLAIVSSAFEVLLVIVMSVYWLAALPGLRDFVLALVPPAHRTETHSVLGEIGQTMGGYVRGVLLEATLIGTITFIALQLIGMEYTLVLAVLAGLGEIVPIVGPIVAAVPAISIALLESPTLALVVLGFYVGLQLLEGYLLFPLVVGKQSHIPPLLIILGLLIGDALSSMLAVLVAIPLAGGVYVVVVRVVAPWLRRRNGGAHHPRR